MSDGWNLAAALGTDLVDHQHRRRRVRLFEVVADTFFKYRRSKRAKRLTLLDAVVEDVFHLGASWIDDDRAVAERPWSKLHLSLEPADHESGSDVLRCSFRYFCISVSFEGQFCAQQSCAGLVVGKLWSAVGAEHV